MNSNPQQPTVAFEGRNIHTQKLFEMLASWFDKEAFKHISS